MGAEELTVPELYTVANAKGSAYTSMNHENRRSNSVYANASIGWRNQAYLDISVRNDWDSTIKDSFFYPSFSASWILTETLPSLTESGWFGYRSLPVKRLLFRNQRSVQRNYIVLQSDYLSGTEFASRDGENLGDWFRG